MHAKLSLIDRGPFGPIQNIHKTFGPCQKVLDIWSCPETFGMDQIHSWTFWKTPNVRDLLPWIKYLLALLDRSNWPARTIVTTSYPKSNADQLRGWSPLLRGIGVTFLGHATDKRRVKNEFGGMAKFAPPHLLKNYFILPSVPQISYQQNHLFPQTLIKVSFFLLKL